ncbi:hypothetical protein PoB_000825200 [Plakobranchus ocellatus]|uniref:Uncharacterized protein n=1 Tax=Plakobranchus ocellatus TaxID=259542 RepID=A0AAV3YH35_9GAST|nr:hypothetical protein PoB_000825200 [Plakobranchus ocellatus]
MTRIPPERRKKNRKETLNNIKTTAEFFNEAEGDGRRRWRGNVMNTVKHTNPALSFANISLFSHQKILCNPDKGRRTLFYVKEIFRPVFGARNAGRK